MRKHTVYVILFSWMLSLGTVAAQGARKDSVTINKELFLQQDFTPVVKDAAKINQMPQMETVEIKKQKIEYVSLGVNPTLRPYPTVVDRALFHTQPPYTDQLGFVRYGIGAYLNMEMAAGISLIKDERQTLNFSYDGALFNGKREIVQIDTSKTLRDSYHNFLLDWKAKPGAFDMSASIFYRHGAFNYVRYDQFDTQNPAAAESNSYLEKTQYNNQFGINFGFAPLKSESFKWKLFAEYGLFNKSISEYVAEGGITEHRVKLKGTGFYRMNDRWNLGGDIFIHSYLYSKNVTTLDDFSNLDSRTRLTFAPKAKFKHSDFNAQIGFRFDPIVSTINKAFLSPDIRLDYRLNRDNYLEASLTGDVMDYDFEYTNRAYRYLNPNIRLSEVHRPYIATIAYRTTLLQLLNVRLSASSFKEREAHFLGVGNGTSALVDLYRKDILGNKLEAEFFYNFNNKGSVRFLANKTFWSLNDEALERPGFQFLIDASYKVLENLNLNLSYNLMGDRHGYNWITDQIEYIRPIHNLALSADYRFGNGLSVFLKGDNLLFQSYDLILGIPAQSATVMIGASYVF